MRYAFYIANGTMVSDGNTCMHTNRHFEKNNFVIFKTGFLTLDTGTRPQPGLHLSHYYARTVAHNCIKIRMPGEIMPPYWDSGPAIREEAVPTYPNDGCSIRLQNRSSTRTNSMQTTGGAGCSARHSARRMPNW